MKKLYASLITVLVLSAILISAFYLAQRPVEAPEPELLVTSAPPIPSVTIPPEQYQKVYDTEIRLLAEHQIALSTDAIRQFIKDNIDISPWEFPAQQQFGRKLLAASEEVVLNGEKPDEVARRYTDNFDEFRFWFSTLTTVSKEDLDTMRSRLYPSYDAMIDSLIPEWRVLAEKKALADVVLPASESASVSWNEYLNQYLLDYPTAQ
ncbi:MAG: hypothetical protein RBU29_13545 [bacterium]|jgi:hypothetical protein|nr:hypothetical protein [bacterium]